MTKVAILPEPSGAGVMLYRAVAKGRQSVAKTAGAALDALTAQLPAGTTSTMVIVQNHPEPDKFFTARQQKRLAKLMDKWRALRDSGKDLPAGEQAELDDLVDAEVKASGERVAAMLAECRK